MRPFFLLGEPRLVPAEYRINKKTTKLQKIFDAYARFNGVAVTDLKFRFRGKAISGLDFVFTAETACIGDGDQIDVCSRGDRPCDERPERLPRHVGAQP